MATTTKKKQAESVEDAPVTETAAEERAARIIRRNVLWSLGAGVIPLAYVDIAAVLAVQLKLVKELSDLYAVPFRANAGKSAIGALVGSLASGGASQALLTTGFVRGLPIVGQIVALATMPAFAAATTYAIGRVFEQHFASGGTFLTFDPKKVEAYFREKFDEARKRDATAAAA